MGGVTVDGLDDIGVAVSARLFGNATIEFSHLDGFVESVGREGQRMKEAVTGLGVVFADEAVGCMAIVAGGHGVVTGAGPTVVLLLHDVTVETSCRVIGQVGCAAGIDEGERTNAADCPDARGQQTDEV